MASTPTRRRDKATEAKAGRARLTREQIARAALEHVDRDGPENLTMRRLADSLGVGTMTLYGYFRDKDELLDAVVEATAPPAPPPRGSGPWREQLRSHVKTLYAALVAHPGVARLRVSRPIITPPALRVTEEGLAILEQAGLGREEAARVYRTLFVYTFGFANFSPEHRTDELRAQARGALTRIGPDEFPSVHAARDELVESLVGGEAQFDHGLDVILDGLEASLPARSSG
jgi:AcrR family transcriptional regulator